MLNFCQKAVLGLLENDERQPGLLTVSLAQSAHLKTTRSSGGSHDRPSEMKLIDPWMLSGLVPDAERVQVRDTECQARYNSREKREAERVNDCHGTKSREGIKSRLRKARPS